MPLPAIPRPDPSLLTRLRELGVTPEFVRDCTEPPDTLFSPLRLTRAASLNDEAKYVALRETFCRPDFHVRYVRGLLVWSDYVREDEREVVMGAGQNTAVLYNAARTFLPAERVLDLGCGAGTLALLIAADARQVTATDISERAVAFTRFNAELNAISNIDVRQGDLFEPVRGEQFDLIVSQPPFYPGSRGPVFLCGGEHGDEIASRLLKGVAPHLTGNGTAVILTSVPADAATPNTDGLGITEYTPGIGEIEGTRHSVLVLKHGEGTARIDIPPARWGRWPI